MSDTIILKPKRRRKDDLISEKQAISAAAACGYSIIKVDQLSNKAKLGAYIEQLGSTRIGRTAVLVASSEIENSIKQIETFIQQNDGGEICLIMDLYKLKAAYIDLLLRASAAQIKTERSAPVESAPPQVLAFPPGTVAAVRVPEQKAIET